VFFVSLTSDREPARYPDEGKGVTFKKTSVTEGSPAKRIVETADNEKVDLIVIAICAGGLSRFFPGVNTE